MKIRNNLNPYSLLKSKLRGFYKKKQILSKKT